MPVLQDKKEYGPGYNVANTLTGTINLAFLGYP